MFGHTSFSEQPFAASVGTVQVRQSLDILWDVFKATVLLEFDLSIITLASFDLNITTQKEIELIR